MYRVRLFIMFLMIAILSGCYHSSTKMNGGHIENIADGAYSDSVGRDSVGYSYADSFYKSHHYGQNYNFVVKADSITLLRQQPEEFISSLPTDSFTVSQGTHLVVVDIRVLHDDPEDSVWIQLARDQYTFGWTRESNLLPNVVPDDPISQFISTFSNSHILVSLVIISAIAITYMLRLIRKKDANVLHFHDIASFYPTLLAISVAAAATFYSSIQLFSPDMWRNFYYHPSLNPFAVPPLLSIFLASLWAMVIMTIAAIDDVYHKLPPSDATLYLCGLAAVCSANYIIFSVTTLYYIGYILLVIYIIFAIKRYARKNFFLYVCGNCGARMAHKGICPKCGVRNK